jgi:hypothetical protein
VTPIKGLPLSMKNSRGGLGFSTARGAARVARDSRVERQEVRGEERFVGDADLVRPELVSCQATDGHQRLDNGARWTWGIRVPWMTDYPDEAILRKWAGCETPVTNSREPSVSLVVLHMRWINESYQDVHVQQEHRHGSSSRSWFTSSMVTGVAPRRLGRSGTPLRSFLV